MSHHFSMGVINKLINEYEYPRIAEKGKKYMCPECKKDVNFCKGQIKQPYFAHKKSESSCYYYDKPSESQIHKDAKCLMKMMLTNKTQMEFYNICSECKDKVYGCCELFKNHYENNMEAIIEYKFEYNNSKKSADVALIKENNIVYIFEICYKNKTRESARPEPWVEIKAEDLIRDINNGSLLDDNGILHIECIRDSICNECEEERVKEIIRMKEWFKRLEQERKERERLDKEKEEARKEKKDKEKKIEWYKQLMAQKKWEEGKDKRDQDRRKTEELRQIIELEIEEEIKEEAIKKTTWSNRSMFNVYTH